ncbi:type IV secretory pathway VirJ component [Pedobacter cryoconitis]|uniref:Type IV secretory pathway VirJ component n=1 Tax=Pedobacter cryoconitis TaxID=188932 RepID=A0A7W8ZIV0_9SPHI|nr:AcvB/VirJ family lysyl-phosphatidylglycerol hydrolase [Pedobacter cryoconitis]MBB5634797.1 type IV secretory pathway VirJ component [Pedobacter cryoconitis]
MKIITILSSCMLIMACGLMKVNAQSPSELSGFPLHAHYVRSTKPLVVFLTGDGGWNSFSESTVKELVKNGYATLALDTRKYFWNQKNPDQFAKDMQVILTSYMKTWNKDSFSMIGYSFGADVAAFVPSRLTEPLAEKQNSLVLLSPGFSTGYVVKLKNLLNFGSTDKEKYKVNPELVKSVIPVLCIFGKDEDSEFYKAIKPTDKIHKVIIPGSHRFDDDIPQVVRAIIKGL